MKEGGIAQLVERLLCKQDVSGSSPLTSTKKEESQKFSTIINREKMKMLDFRESS